MSTTYPMNERQREFLSWRFGLFLHFNMSTFTGSNWANGYEDPSLFAPDRLDCDQWAEAAVAAGMRYAVLTVKHTGGWLLWQSDTTSHGMQSFTNYHNGKGDVVREFTDAFRARGLKVGLYYCGPGPFSSGSYAGRFGPLRTEDQPELFGMPPEASPDYIADMKQHFTELLTRYRTIDLVWFDQWFRMESTRSRWQEIRAHIRGLQPGCLVLGNNAHEMHLTDIWSCEVPYDPSGLVGEGNPFPAEVSDTLSGTWFWPRRDDLQPTKSAQEVVDMLQLCNRRNANYLLNIPPDRLGLITQPFVDRLREIGDLLR